MRNLKQLYLNENNLTDVAATAIAESEHLTKLTHISLAHNDIKSLGASVLASSENMANLTHLWLTNNKIQQEGMQAIAISDHLNNLEYLDVSQCEIGNEGIQVLSLTNKRKLKFINLNHNGISSKGFKILSECENMPLLSEIKIYEGNPVSNEFKSALKRSKFLPALRHIQ